MRAAITNLSIIVLFIAVLLLPTLGNILPLAPQALLTEKRQLKPFPPLSPGFASLVAFPGRFEQFYDDHLGCRDGLIYLNNMLKVTLFSVSPTDKVVLGRQNWLFYAGGNAIDYYPEAKILTNQQLQDWQSAFEAKRRWLAQQGIVYLIVVAPEKHSIYPEYLPDTYPREHGPTVMDQVAAYLTANSDIKILDLRETLRRRKGCYPLYYRTDTHWNACGAFFAQAEIIGRLDRSQPQASGLSLDDYSIVARVKQGGDLAEMLSLSRRYKDTGYELTPKQQRSAISAAITFNAGNKAELAATESRQGRLGKAVMFHDSFGNALRPFLSEQFRRIVYLGGYFSFDPALIEQERPAIVIEEIVERYFKHPPPVAASITSRHNSRR